MKMQIGGYERKVKEGARFTEVTITWPPGTRTKSHDHNTFAEVVVAKGRVFEIRDGVKIYYTKGQSFQERADEAGSRHIVGNDTDEEAVTHHLYQGKLVMNEFPDDLSEVTLLEGT